jgi:hypothetical protein
MPQQPRLPASLGLPVTTRDFNLLEMVSRAWGSEFAAPDHRVYCWGNGIRCFDSTDMGTTGIYQRGLSTAVAPVLSGVLIGNNEIDLSWTEGSVYGSEIDNYLLFRQVDGGAFALLSKLGEDGFFYRDFGVSAGHTYGYYVESVPCVGNTSPPSNTVSIAIPVVVVCTQHLIQAGPGIAMPGGSGIGSSFVGWFGQNDGVAGPGTFGSTVSGQGLFLPGAFYGYADGVDAIRIPFVGPFFIVYNPAASSQNAFSSVTINGHTYLTASVPYFDNAAGCGPTYWIWTGQPAGLVNGQQYCVVWTL